MTLRHPMNVKEAYPIIRYTWYQASLWATRLKIRSCRSASCPSLLETEAAPHGAAYRLHSHKIPASINPMSCSLTSGVAVFLRPHYHNIYEGCFTLAQEAVFFTLQLVRAPASPPVCARSTHLISLRLQLN